MKVKFSIERNGKTQYTKYYYPTFFSKLNTTATLLPDISNLFTVNLPPFLDIFIFSYLQRTQFVSKCGRIFCTTGEEGSDKKVVARTALAEQGAFGTKTSILQTVGAQGAIQGSTIRATIASIEHDTDRKTREA